MSPPSTFGSLAIAPLEAACQVLGVTAPAHAPQWARWLEDIGFVAGESVCVLSRARPGDDPMVVRVGQSTFALRRAEAACVTVRPAPV